MTERYTGPSAKRIADLLPHRVSFERGWFWTTTATCHGGRSDGLAFRQRPDGRGHRRALPHRGLLGRRGDNAPGDCHRAAHLDGLRACERHRGQGPREAAVVEAQAGRRGRAVALIIAAALITGDVEVFTLNLVGLGIGALLLRRFLARRTVWRFRR